MTAAESCEIGLALLGAIIFTGQSVSSFGGFTSGISLVLAGITSFLSERTKPSVKPPVETIWLQLLSRLSLLSGASHCLAGLLEFYDVGNGAAPLGPNNVSPPTTVTHLVPTAIMPHVMPITILVIVAILFILGLDESFFLLRLSKWLLATVSLLFVTVALFHTQINLETKFPFETVPDKILKCICLWTVFLTEMKTTVIFQHASLNLVLVVLLSLLPITSTTKSLLLPLGASAPVYEAIQVPLAACCLGMALYSLYIPAIQLALRCHFSRFLTKENSLTGTHLNVIALIGLICCLLVTLFNLTELLFIASLAETLKRCADQLVNLFSPYRAENAVTETHSKACAKYEELSQLDCSPDRETETGNEDVALSEDSGHSSEETDIDELVEEYQSKTKVLGPFYNEMPTKFTSRVAQMILLGATGFSVCLYVAILNSDFLLVIIFFVGLTSLHFGLRCVPKDRSKTTRGHEMFLFSLSFQVILCSSVLSTAWAPVSCWAVLGGGLRYLEQSHRGCCWQSRSQRESRVNLGMGVPSMKIRVQRVQTHRIQKGCVI